MDHIKHTDWNQCAGGPWYPNLSHGGFVAYRIWVEFDGRRWSQRHEWKCSNGETQMEEWIPSTAGFGSASIEAIAA
jgi:hypothetical protein